MQEVFRAKRLYAVTAIALVLAKLIISIVLLILMVQLNYTGISGSIGVTVSSNCTDTYTHVKFSENLLRYRIRICFIFGIVMTLLAIL